MSMPLAEYFTADMVRALPDDGKRYETVHGELLVSPSPRIAHQAVLINLFLEIGTYLKDHGIRGAFCVDADISWSPDTLVQPDLFVADPDEVRRAASWDDVQTLYLAVEILSPSSLRADRFVKRRLYQEQRIPAYWVIDIDNRLVEAWTPGAIFPVVEHGRLTWRHPALDLDCVIELADLFRN